MNIRKITISSLIVIFLGITFILIPLSLVYLNKYLNLPIYFNPCFKIFGIAFIAFGLGAITYSTTLHIKTGRKSPLPVIEKPKQFIATGLYKYSRNPMYLTETFTFLGLFLIFGSVLLLLYAAIFFLIANLLVVYFEEPELRRLFGKEYIGYTKKVPRWIPKLSNIIVSMKCFRKRKTIFLLLIAILIVIIFGINQIFYLREAHGTFENYYAFRGCTKLLKKTQDYGICKTSFGQTIKIVKFDNRWFLDGDLPCGFLCF
jgi:protein-S-isoprenylcysteine O-methyltransferase Ste14